MSTFFRTCTLLFGYAFGLYCYYSTWYITVYSLQLVRGTLAIPTTYAAAFILAHQALFHLAKLGILFQTLNRNIVNYVKLTQSGGIFLQLDNLSTCNWRSF